MNVRFDSKVARTPPLFTQPFLVLATFLVLLFATGGSSWPHEAQLIILRPVAILVAAWGLWTMQPHHWRENRIAWTLFAASVALTASHLIPLPFSVWSQLPGREVIAEIDAVTGLGQIVRPMSMQPELTLNALLALAIPAAVMSWAVQLDVVAHRRIAGILIALVAVSAFVGLLQLAGTQLSLFESISEIRPSGLFNNRNHQGVLLAMVFPLAMLAWNGGYRSGLPVRLERWAATGFGFLILPLAFVTGSRLGLLLAALAFIFVLIDMSRTGGEQNGGKPKIAKPLGVLIGAAMLAGLTIMAGRGVALSRFFAAEGDIRNSLWKSTLDAIPTYMPWGSGIGTFADVYQISEPASMLRAVYWNHAHNEVLEIALTAGIPGLLILGAAVIAVIISAVRLWGADRNGGALQRTGLVLILLLVISSISDYPVRTPILAGVLALSAVWISRPLAEEAQSRKAG